MIEHWYIGIAWYCMVLHGIALYCIVLHGIAWYLIRYSESNFQVRTDFLIEANYK